VTGVCTPAEALDLTRAGGLTGVDLLITDVVLTEMKGTELAALLRERMPGLRILFTSGYTDEITFQNGVLAQGDAFLQKPYSRNALASKVREILDAHPRP
jgi:CheY-like chemotaxis protein